MAAIARGCELIEHLVALLGRLQGLQHALGPLSIADIGQADLLVLRCCVRVLLNWLRQSQELVGVVLRSL